MGQNPRWVWIAAGYLLACSPLLAPWLVTELDLRDGTDRLAHTLLPLALGFLGLVLAVRNFKSGHRVNAMMQIMLTAGCTLWALVIAGFALAVTHGSGI